MRKKRILDDEWWRPKRVITDLEKKAKSSYAYNNQLGIYKNRFKSVITYTKTSSKKQTEVVIKFTGSSKNYEGLKAHLRYISRNGEVEVQSSDGCKFIGKSDLNILSESFNSGDRIPTQREIRDNSLKEQREAIHVVFSMKDYQFASGAKIKEAAMNCISKMYPDNYFCIAIHNDTDNPHCHLVLKVKDYLGRRINPKKSDIANMRLSFANELIKLGVEAKATTKSNSRNSEKDKGIYIAGDYNNGEKHKAHHYKVTGYGRANYKFDKDNEESFFVSYMTTKGKEIFIWANDLERVVKENDVKIDDYCRFVITAESPVTFNVHDKKKNVWYEKTAYKKVWDVSIENKNEKVLEPLKNFTPNDYKQVDEPYNEVVDFGIDHYQFNYDMPKSYFVKMLNPNRKEFCIWGKDLENIIKNENIVFGDKCKFSQQGKDEYGKNIWVVDIQGRDTKAAINRKTNIAVTENKTSAGAVDKSNKTKNKSKGSNKNIDF